MTLNDKKDKYLLLIHLTIELFYLHCELRLLFFVTSLYSRYQLL